jgi:hypothetical protein
VPSPLPGMDPYLESPKLWPAFHRHIVAAVYQSLLPGLVDRYRARVSTRSYTSELVLFTSVTREPHDEEYIEIRSRTDGRLVTLVEVVSLGNRTTVEGKATYLATRMAAQREKAGVVEIDLLTQGKPPFEFDRATLPPHDHTVTVTRGGTPDRYEIYTSGVRKRLPKFKLPLAADDRDTVLDLQVAYARGFDAGGFDRLIDHTAPLPPDVKLADEDREWVREQVNPRSKR